MNPRTACFCLAAMLVGGAPAYPETYYRTTDNNGVICFSNTRVNENSANRGLAENPGSGSPELQKAREQAELEYWRAVEAKARSLRNTPDTEVHRRPGPSLQRENSSMPQAPYRKRFSVREKEQMAGATLQDRNPAHDPTPSKRVRSKRMKIRDWNLTTEPESQKTKRRSS
jgi:hypothetical protein